MEKEQNYTPVESFEHEDADRAYRAKLRMGALALGIEAFDTKKAQELCAGDFLSQYDGDANGRLAELEMDYYESGAKNMDEWTNGREKYEVVQDATGKDEE